jgi:Carboxypeptidase regulatory-like domain/PDZ domain
MLRHRSYLAAGAVPLFLLGVLLWRFGTQGPQRGGLAPDGGAAEAARPSGAPGRPAARAIVPDLPIHVVLPPTPSAAAAFEGRVVSAATGLGVAGAELTFSRSGEATSVPAAADGTFRFEPRLTGRWTLAAVSAAGFLPFAPEWGHSPVLLDAREGARVRGITIALMPAIEYLGRVVDADGRPMAGADVRILGAAAGETALLPLRERFTTDAAGELRFSAPDGAVLEARRAGYATGTATVDFAARLSRRVTVVLRPAATAREELAIAGRVVTTAGEPADGAVVAAEAEDEADPPPRQATTGVAGDFALRGLPPGTYRLLATRPGAAPALQRGVRAGAGDVVLTLQAGGRLSGRVRDRRSGEPVVPFTVAVRARGRTNRFLPLRTLAVVDASGRYEMDDLAPGRSVVVVAAPGHAPSAEVDVTIPEAGAPAATVDFDLSAGGRIDGIVLDARTRQPIAGAEIEVEGQVELGPSPLPVLALAASGPDGRFQLTGVPEVPLSLRASAVGHHARIFSGVEVHEGDTRPPISIELTPLEPGEEPRVELTGIGAVLARRGELLAIVSVVPGGGAAEAGLAPGDQIVRIDGLAVAELPFGTAVNLIRGPEGSSVVLGVRRRDDPQRAELRVVVVRRLVRN